MAQRILYAFFCAVGLSAHCGGEVTSTDAATDANSSPFTCGDSACTSATQFCETIENGGAGGQVTFTHECVALPAGCSSCECLLDSGVVTRCYQPPKCDSNGGALTTSTNCAM
jgi:hypothetical protein